MEKPRFFSQLRYSVRYWGLAVYFHPLYQSLWNHGRDGLSNLLSQVVKLRSDFWPHYVYSLTRLYFSCEHSVWRAVANLRDTWNRFATLPGIVTRRVRLSSPSFSLHCFLAEIPLLPALPSLFPIDLRFWQHICSLLLDLEILLLWVESTTMNEMNS